MGKYFDGTRFDYIRTGSAKLSKHAIRNFAKNSTNKKKKDRLGTSFRKNGKSILDNRMDTRRSFHPTFNLLLFRQRNSTNKDSGTTTIMKKISRKKKVSKWQSLVNGVKVRYTRNFIVLRNRAKQLYEFLDEI